VHAITQAKLNKCRTRVAALKALLHNASIEAAEGEDPIVEPCVEDVDTNVGLHGEAMLNASFPT